MSRKARLTSGTHRRRRDDARDEVIRAGEVFEPTEREAAQNADRLEWLEGTVASGEYTIDDTSPGWYKVIDPQGEQVGMSHRSREAAEAVIADLVGG